MRCCPTDSTLLSTHATADTDPIFAYPDLLRLISTCLPSPSTTIVNLTSALLRPDYSARDYGMTLHAWNDHLHALRPASKVDLFLKIMESIESSTFKGVVSDQVSGQQQMLHILIKCLTQSDLALSQDLHACLAKLCTSLQSTSEIGQFGSCIASINTILRTKQFLVSQHGIDTLLVALTTISSPSSPLLPKKHAPFIYLQVCRTTNNLLLLHRKRVGGRMHLLIPLLQNLLGALFVTHVRSTSSLPSWLHDNIGSLTAEHATSYSRVLITLSSPTVSSTQSRKHTSIASMPNLIDATKQARLYAGQYIPYILMHYCSLQLTGMLEGAMKEEVKRGIWSCMDIVDLEGMRALSEGIGRDERVMWASLFKEWQRFGTGGGRGKRA
jgi:hypothetical protein